MEFNDRAQSGIAHFELSGKIMGGNETEDFHERLKDYIGQGVSSVVLDLKDVVWINSVGLGMLIRALTSVKHAGGRLVLVNTATVDSLIKLTGLQTVFDVYDSQEAAIRSFENG